MSRKEWGALMVVMVVVMGLQLIGHGDQDLRSGRGHPDHPPPADAPGGSLQSSPETGGQQGMFRTVALEVRGMT